jgi:hypothetical protein
VGASSINVDQESRAATFQRYASSAAADGDSTDSTAQIFGCVGTLAGNPALCAALNWHVGQLLASGRSGRAIFCRAVPAGISVTTLQYMVVAVGWRLGTMTD